MEHKSNDEKANEIARDMLPYNNAEYHACYNSAMKAMKWKDEQFQKVLDYAENCYGVFSFEQRENFINHIKNIFYGKE